MPAALAAALIAVGLAVGGGAAASAAGSVPRPAAVVPAAEGGLSDSGQQAIADLRTCLASSSVLNVYYLIDASGSLKTADDGGPGSDPETLRAPILANSLEQLGGLDEGATVNWAMGFFSSAFSATIDWREWKQGGPDELEKAIRDRSPGGFTNWPAALSGAQRELAAQQQAAPGCQMLVWLTDGQIDIEAPDGVGPEDRDALNALCGAQLDAEGGSPTGHGLFNALRQSGVVVIGALLATDPKAAAAGQVMRPLIEGSGAVAGRDVTCGEHPVPAGYAHGAFVEATSPGALSQVFLQLGAQVGGGYPHPFDADGSFWIDPGVARFQIVLSGDWTLVPPGGSGLEAASGDAAQPWATVGDQNGATVIEVATADAATQGQWRLEAGDTRSLFLFSDLGIVFDDTNSIELSPDGTTSARLVAHVRTAGGEDAGLDVYGSAGFAAWLVEADGSQRALADAEVDARTGTITIPVPADVTAAEVVVGASIDPLTTKPHDLTLAPITTLQRIATVLPKDFPHVATVPVRLSALEGADGRAEGAIEIVGPESGQPGEACVAGAPSVTSDAASRDETWRWTPAEGTCVTVAAGETARIALSAANSEAADSTVQATVPVTLRSAAGQSLTQQVPVTFTSTHPVNVAAVSLIALVLLLLGILLPLAGLWLVNWWTTRLDLDPKIQRGVFPVRLTARGAVFTDAPASDTALSERFDYRREQGTDRSIADPALGRIHAVLPWFPLRAPAYEIAPAAGRVIVTARTGRTARAGARTADGSVRFAQLPFAEFWAVTVPADELLRTSHGDEVTGTAVLYHRFDATSPSQYRDRLAEISADATLLEFADRLRTELQAQAARGTDAGAPGPAAGSPSAGSAPAVPPRPSAPPRPGATAGGAASAPSASPSAPSATPSAPSASPSAPSARPAGAPGTTASPPPRPGSAPPPRPGAAPPRQSSPPPRG